MSQDHGIAICMPDDEPQGFGARDAAEHLRLGCSTEAPRSVARTVFLAVQIGGDSIEVGGMEDCLSDAKPR